MRVTVCELRSAAIEEDWPGLVEHVRAERSELVLLPEMGLSPWFARTRPARPAAWHAAVAAHEAWLPRLDDLAPAAVLGTRPADLGGRRQNLAFVREDGRERAAHVKRHLPDEEDFWEASWYEPGDGSFDVFDAGGARAGFLVCTELWFMHHARTYAEAGAQLVAVPRCTPSETLGKWLAGGRAAAVVAGAYALSSNHGDERFGGMGWVIDPDGEVLATTSRDRPYATVEVDLAAADAAKATYPRYVPAT